MDIVFEWPPGLFSIQTSEFDRALALLRAKRNASVDDPSRVFDLAKRLKSQTGISRREFDRRFRIVVATIVRDDLSALQAIAGLLREGFPEALNALRTLLPAEQRHVAIATPPSDREEPQDSTDRQNAASDVSVPVLSSDAEDATEQSEFYAVALIGTAEEHVRNRSLLQSHKLHPLTLSSLEELWNVAPTGLCGFVVGGSVWKQLNAREQSRSIRLVCQYSTFLFSRVCLDGLNQESARTFVEKAIEARCGSLDAQKFCYGHNCDLTEAEIYALQATARLLEAAGTVEFFPLGLTEPEAALLRLIAEERRPRHSPVTIRRLGTRELAGGRSGARVFLVNNGGSHAFVSKIGESEHLVREILSYQDWIKDWEPSATNPSFHSHLQCAAITYRVQATPDVQGHPAPTLEDRLEDLRSAEWTQSLEKCNILADDLYVALDRSVDYLVALNSRQSGRQKPDSDFWLHWPISALAERGIEFTIVDKNWQSFSLSELVQKAFKCLTPNLSQGVIHGDVHGRNILLLDRTPAFIDFAWSGPGHPLTDLCRLDSAVRTASLRMLLNKQSMTDLVKAIYVDGVGAVSILAAHPAVVASPLARLAIRTAVKVRSAAQTVCHEHGLSISEFYAMQCIVSAYLLANHYPGSGIERLVLSVVGSEFLSLID